MDPGSRRWLAAVLLLSLALRVAAPFVFPELAGEQTRRHEIATNLAEGRGFTLCMGYFPFCRAPGNDTTASVGPLAPVVFAGLIKAFGELGIPLILAIQALVGVWITYLTYRVSLRLFGRERPALLAALLFALYLPMVQYGMRLRGETLAALFVALFFLALEAGIRRGHARHWLGAGALLGLLALTRTPFVYFPLVLAAAAPFLVAGPATRRLLASAALLGGFALVLSPWVVRNTLAFHAFIPGGTLTGYNLFRHNHLLAGDHPFHYVENQEAGDAVSRLIHAHPELRGDENEHEMDVFYRAAALDIIGAHPGRYLQLSLLRFLGVWTPARNYEPAGLLGEIGPLGAVNLALLALAVATALRRRLLSPRVLLPIVLLFAYYTVGHMLVNARVRYVGPLMPLVVVLAADQILPRRPDGARTAPGQTPPATC